MSLAACGTGSTENSGKLFTSNFSGTWVENETITGNVVLNCHREYAVTGTISLRLKDGSGSSYDVHYVIQMPTTTGQGCNAHSGRDDHWSGDLVRSGQSGVSFVVQRTEGTTLVSNFKVEFTGARGTDTITGKLTIDQTQDGTTGGSQDHSSATVSFDFLTLR